MQKGKSSFLQNASVLMLGTAFGQAFILAVTPFLARLYSPSAFGEFALFVSVFSIVNIVASMRYELGIPLTKGDHFALLIVILSLSIITILTLLLFVFSSSLQLILQLLTEQEISIIFVITIILSITVASAYRVISMLAFRTYNFRAVGIARAFQGLGLGVTQLFLGVLGNVKYGLIFGHFVGFSLSLAVLLLAFLKSLKAAIKRVNFKRLGVVAIRYRKFPLYSVWSDMLNVLGYQIPTLVLLYFYSPVEAGLYFLAMKLSNAPVSVVSEVVSKTFYAMSAKPQNREMLSKFSGDFYHCCFRFVFGPVICLIPFCDLLFSTLFGKSWEVSGTYFQVLLIASMSIFVNTPFLTLFHTTGSQQKEFFCQVIILLCRLFPITIFSAIGSAYSSIFAYSVFTAASYFIAALWALSTAKVNIGNLIKRMLFDAMWTMICLVFIYGLVTQSNAWCLSIASCLFLMVCSFSIVSAIKMMRVCTRDLVS